MNGINVPTDPKIWVIAGAVAINLVPIAGVVFWGWSAFALIFLYWLENIVIGVRTVASMVATALLGGGTNWRTALFFAAFFTVHYGIFCFVHGSFVVLLFGNPAVGGADMELVGATRALFAQQPSLFAGLASIGLWQVIQFILFLVRGEAGRSSPAALMAAPYPRIIILHLAIIFGGFLLMLLNQPLAGLIVLALIKTAFDVAEANRQETRAALPTPANQP